MGLSGLQRQQLQEALMDGFPKKSSLEQMLSFQLNKSLDVVAPVEGNLRDIVFELIREAEAENWVENLIDAARRVNPGNQKLKAYAQSFRIKTSDDGENTTLSKQEMLEVEQPILAGKGAQYPQQQEAERRRQQQTQTTTITSPSLISQKQFLKWLGLGSGGVVIAVAIALNQDKESQNNNEKEVPPKSSTSTKATYQTSTFNFETVEVNGKGIITGRENKKGKYFKEDLDNDISLEMVEIPSGDFKMGSPKEEKGSRDSERPQREVRVSSFFMGKFEVTQAQWRAVAKLPQVKRELKPEPSHFKGDNRPVEQVSWNDAVEFCARLSKHTGRKYRLPSEAEWEYACRAGTTTVFHFGETITGNLANYNASNVYANEPKGKYRQETDPVGQSPANAFGLYDMHGNVLEWCLDDWHSNYERASTDGSALINSNNNNRSQFQVLRGGSWYSYPGSCRSACRDDYVVPNRRNYGIGFRVVCAMA